MDAGSVDRWTPRNRAKRAVAIAATVLLVIVAFNAVIDPNSIAVLVWGTGIPPLPPTL